jgi:hypothetical protein
MEAHASDFVLRSVGTGPEWLQAHQPHRYKREGMQAATTTRVPHHSWPPDRRGEIWRRFRGDDAGVYSLLRI